MDSVDPTLHAFLAAAHAGHRVDAGVARPLLERALADAMAAYPAVFLDPARFYAYLAPRLSEQLSLGDALAGAHVADLYLACACLDGDRAALIAFEATTRDVVGATLARFGLSSAERDDVAQTLRVAFFVKKSLTGYSGRGALRGWVRSAATRAALDLVDARKRRPDDEESILGALPATGDVELDLFRGRFAGEFRKAFAETVASLAPEDRTVLIQHYVDDLSIDQLGVVLGVHRATAARRVARLREALLEGTRQRLASSLKVDDGTFESLMRAAASQLDASVFRLLKG